MITLKLRAYKLFEEDLNVYLNQLNSIAVNNELASYITGLPVNELDTNLILRQQAFDKTSKLPNFTDYLTNGIDMSLLMPNCIKSDGTLKQITDTVESAKRDRARVIGFVSYSTKSKQFEINTKGNECLKGLLTVLDEVEEELYKRVYDLYKFCNDKGKNFRHIFNEDLINFNTIQDDSLVHRIKKQ